MYSLFENGKALRNLTENHGVITQETPIDYFSIYTTAAEKALEMKAKENAFFSEVWQSQKDFADIIIPFWFEKQTTNTIMGKLFLMNKNIVKEAK